MNQPPLRAPRPVFRAPAPVIAPTPTVGFLDKYKYWIVVAVVVLIAGATIVYLMRQNSRQGEKNKEVQAEYRVRAEQYAQKRGDELATQMARKMVTDYLQQPGSRHDLGDPGILPDLGCVSDWETNVSQKCAPNNTAVTTDIRQIGSTAPPPIDGPGSVKLAPANADDDFQGATVAPLPTISERQQAAPTNKSAAT